MSKKDILDFCKKLLRQSNTNVFDDEITSLIDACLIDLNISAVNEKALDDPMIKRTIGIYVKAHFGYENPDRFGLIKSYDYLKTHLAITKKYGQELEHEKSSAD